MINKSAEKEKDLDGCPEQLKKRVAKKLENILKTVKATDDTSKAQYGTISFDRLPENRAKEVQELHKNLEIDLKQYLTTIGCHKSFFDRNATGVKDSTIHDIIAGERGSDYDMDREIKYWVDAICSSIDAEQERKNAIEEGKVNNYEVLKGLNESQLKQLAFMLAEKEIFLSSGSMKDGGIDRDGKIQDKINKWLNELSD